MALTDFLTTDPIAKRAKRLQQIEQQQIECYTQQKELRRKAAALKREFETVRNEIKAIRKGKA